MRFLAVLSLLLTGCSSLLYYPTSRIYVDLKQIRHTHELVEFGEGLSGLLICAKNCLGDKPVVVQFHGNGQNMTAHMLSLMWLTDRGYDLFTFDYAGYGASKGSPSPEGTLHDGEAAVSWIEKRFPGRKVIIYGQSLGGAVALRLVADHKIPASLVVAESTFDSYEDIAADVLSRTWVTWPFQWLAYLFMSDRYAPGARVKDISPIPLIVIHSEKDRTVPLRFGEKIFAEAREPKQIWIYKEPGHVISSIVENGAINEKLLKEFAKL